MNSNYTFENLFNATPIENDKKGDKDPYGKSVSLRDVTRLIDEVISEHFSRQFIWVRAEVSGYKQDPRKGHIYFDLIEKDGDIIAAQMRANAWGNMGFQIKRKFENGTGESLRAGIKVMLLCEVTFHEQYGISLKAIDIEPNYTLGDMEAQRREIIARLKADGVIDMNKSLPFPSLPRCVAVISSESAAGYEDFENQLQHNKYNVNIASRLYPAIMQGEQTAISVIHALQKIGEHLEKGIPFDAVAILRGGGAKADLSWFDNYELANEVAQFPLPVIIAIGHTRDNGVLDMVANQSVKTPTECAEFLVRQLAEQLFEIDNLTSLLKSFSQDTLHKNRLSIDNLIHSLQRATYGKTQERTTCVQQLIKRLQVAQTRICAPTQIMQLKERLQAGANNFLLTRRHDTHSFNIQLHVLSENILLTQLHKLRMKEQITLIAQQHFLKEQSKIEVMEQKLKLLNPIAMMEMGYALVTKNGKRVKQASELQQNDKISLLFMDGNKNATIND